MTIEISDIVQIKPEHDERFGACLLTVTEVKSWGVQGFVRIPASGDAYYRCKFDAIEPTGGKAVFMPAPEEGDEP